ncbi:DDB1- and CUL4-associated factor 13 (WD repeat and SOF domain-containing protein 1) [Psidium guajava]|nr:DDB1- and CUL4-associated factor 13 (WD repeat and SOF domain-containing protein 1) [Psidium guajava]
MVTQRNRPSSLASPEIDRPSNMARSHPSLSQETRAASLHLFSSLRPFSPKSPFDPPGRRLRRRTNLQQIDLQSQPLLSTLRRELKRFEKNPTKFRICSGTARLRRGKGRSWRRWGC